MSAIVESLPLPKVSDDFLNCAQRHGVAAFVFPILEMTRRLFPEAPMAVAIHDDPEDEELHFLAFEVAIPHDAEVDWLLAIEKRWVEELFQLCPPDKALPFILSLV